MKEARISIVVPALGTRDGLQDTLQSLEQQDYPALEVLVEDSSEGRTGFAEALNAGFARATGDLHAYVKPGERLLPGALRAVAQAFGEDRGRDLVMGGSIIRLAGASVEHPREYLGPFDHLAIWKRRWNTVPQPSVFWRRALLDRCGPFAPGPACAVDYDFICRAGRHYALHAIDSHLSEMPLAADTGAAAIPEAEELELLIEVSRRHWGSWLSPLRWRCELSFLRYAGHAHEHARHHARRGEEAARQGRCLEAAARFARTWLLAPAMARGRWKVVSDLCARRRGS